MTEGNSNQSTQEKEQSKEQGESGEKKPRVRLGKMPVKQILCVECGQGGGTLVKVGSGVYKHTRCR